MLSGIKRLTSSSAAIVLGLAVIGVIVMNVAGRVDGPTALDFIKWLVIFFFAKIAVEDAAAKIAAARVLVSNAEPTGGESRERVETPSRAPTMKIKIDELFERTAESKEVK